MLKSDKYRWNNNLVLFTSLTKACKNINNRVRTQLPISQGLLEILLFELEHLYHDQSYLLVLYRAVFALGYYGLLRVGELAKSQHCIRAKNIHVGVNKNKILVILYTSKTHNSANKPQKIKVTAGDPMICKKKSLNFCPFQLLRDYIAMRGQYSSDDKQFFHIQWWGTLGDVPCQESFTHMYQKNRTQ